MTSLVGTSANTVIVMHRLAFCLAATTAVAVDRPTLTTISSSTGPAPTSTARANTADTERTDFSGNRLAAATIAWTSTCEPSTTCR